jgi:hypothetical protein
MLRLEIAEAILVLQCKWGELLSVPQGERFAYSLPTKGYNRAQLASPIPQTGQAGGSKTTTRASRLVKRKSTLRFPVKSAPRSGGFESISAKLSVLRCFLTIY